MKKIFLVEDEITIRESIEKMIPWEEYGFCLAGDAADGEKALPAILDLKPEVLITDIRMPFMDGLALSRVVKQELPDTKIIILSGYDDFDYARQAVEIGIEQYLLKPITKNAFIEVLKTLRDKFESESRKNEYYNQFRSELQEYEQNARRTFFEKLLDGSWSVPEIYAQAQKLHIDLAAESYCILIFSIETKEDYYSNESANLQEKIARYLLSNGEYLLFRIHRFCYGILVKDKRERISDTIHKCLENIRYYVEEETENVEWYIGVGKTVDRISQAGESCQAAEKAFSFRYLNSEHIIYSENISLNVEEMKEPFDIENIDMSAVGQEILLNFLHNGTESEVEDFVRGYFQKVGKKTLRSMVFRQYIVLNFYFCVRGFVEKIGYAKEELIELDISDSLSDISLLPELVEDYAGKVLNRALQLRDKKAGHRFQGIITRAVAFLQENYTDEELSLNKAASAVNVSANHFSALFSQQVGKTFVEYLTELRMQKARELLKCTAMRSGEIAFAVGYKDSHYFSYLFKKTQGMTPSEYRNKK